MKSLNLSCAVVSNAISLVGNALLNSHYNENVVNRKNYGLTNAMWRKIAKVTLVTQFFALPLTLTACKKRTDSEEPTISSSETNPNKVVIMYYKVGSGDNLTFIADAFGVTIDEILSYNPKIKDSSLIKVGDILSIPYYKVLIKENSKLNGSISVNGEDFLDLKAIFNEYNDTELDVNENEEDESLVNDWSDKLSKDGYVKGIDISNWQKSMDLNKVLKKNPEIDFVMVRAGYFVEEGASEGLDGSFVNFAKVCAEANKPMGIYYWPSFFSKEEAEKETKLILDTLSGLKDECGLKLEMPIALDIELKEDGGGTVVKRILEEDPDTLEAIETTINILSEAGYYVTIYIGNNALKSYPKLQNFVESLDVDTWIPKYASNKTTSISSEPTIPNVSYDGFTGIKQYSQTGSLKGYNGFVDLDLAFVNYPKIMREKNLGGFEEENRSLSFRN